MTTHIKSDSLFTIFTTAAYNQLITQTTDQRR